MSAITNAQNILDENKESMPEGVYLQMCDALLVVYKEKKEEKKEDSDDGERECQICSVITFPRQEGFLDTETWELCNECFLRVLFLCPVCKGYRFKDDQKHLCDGTVVCIDCFDDDITANDSE